MHVFEFTRITLNACTRNDIALWISRLTTHTTHHSDVFKYSLSLEWNYLGLDGGIDTLVQGLQRNKTLTKLDIRNNSIGPDGSAALAKLITTNTTLKEIDLRWNCLHSAGGQTLVEAMKFNQSLTELKVSGNKIPYQLQSLLESALKRNKVNAQVLEEKSKLQDELKVEMKEALSEYEAREKVLLKQEEALKERIGDVQSSVEMQIDDVRKSMDKERASVEAEKREVAKQLSESQIELSSYHAKLEAEQQTFSEYKNEMGEKLKEYTQDKIKVVAEADGLRRELELAKEREDDLLLEADDAKKQIKILGEKLDRTEKMAAKRLEISSGDNATLTRENAHLVEKLKHAELSLETKVKDYEAQLAHAEKLASSERDIHETETKELLRRHERETHDQKDGHLREHDHAVQRISALEEDLASARSQVNHLRQENIKLQITHEEKFAAYENKLRKEHGDKHKAQLDVLEERILSIHKQRDLLQSRSDQQTKEYDLLVSQMEREREEQNEWLEEERNATATAEQKYQSTISEMNQLRTENVRAAHRVASMEQSVQQLTAQRENLIQSHNDDIDKVLKTHGIEISSLEEQLRAADDQCIQLRDKLRSAELTIANLKAQQNRREDSVQTALNGLRLSLNQLAGAPAGGADSTANTNAMHMYQNIKDEFLHRSQYTDVLNFNAEGSRNGSTPAASQSGNTTSLYTQDREKAREYQEALDRVKQHERAQRQRAELDDREQRLAGLESAMKQKLLELERKAQGSAHTTTATGVSNINTNINSSSRGELREESDLALTRKQEREKRRKRAGSRGHEGERSKNSTPCRSTQEAEATRAETEAQTRERERAAEVAIETEQHRIMQQKRERQKAAEARVRQEAEKAHQKKIERQKQAEERVRREAEKRRQRQRELQQQREEERREEEREMEREAQWNGEERHYEDLHAPPQEAEIATLSGQQQAELDAFLESGSDENIEIDFGDQL